LEIDMTPKSLFVPSLTVDQMIEVDKLMLEKYHIELIQMMENSGRNLADLASMRFLGGDVRNKRIAVLAGNGGNGGGVMVSARHLQNWGARISLILAAPTSAYAGVPAHQLNVLDCLKVPVLVADGLNLQDPFDLILDGLIGYGLTAAPRGTTSELIEWANQTGTPILALDNPSGMDSTNGKAHNPTIRATATMTLALPKTGLLKPGAEKYVGELYLADISVPPELYENTFGILVPELFYKNTLMRIQTGVTI
jgi:NAD(P)H-hydrate epimerase